MPLDVGARIGPFEIVAPLGAGGMGQVYRARDLKLNRTVALKALLDDVAGSSDRIARFEREAHLLASLDHPNIAAIHGVQDVRRDGAGQTEPGAYLVLEFVEGCTLADAIRVAGAITVDDAIVIARQIADAIGAAHEKGIIHRDLKPGNIMLRGAAARAPFDASDCVVKVLDFGLGKAITPESDGASQPSNSPTMTLAATQQGIILGTAGYMSPEQAKGRGADKRSDVWAFGCVFFEMLSGTRAFEGEDLTETLAAIVRGEPDYTALPANTPPAVRALIERCLIKDRSRRIQDMSVVRYILDEPSTAVSAASAPGVQAAVKRRASIRVPVPLVAEIVASAVLLTVAVLRWRPSAAPVTAATGLSRFTIVLPPGDEVGVTNIAPLAMSPQGTAVAYVGLRDGKQLLFLREFAASESRVLAGTDGARSPFFSPDGRWIGFFATGRLKKIAASGTGLQELAAAAESRGGTWSTDDTIYFAPTNTSGLMKVAASGGEAVEVTRPNREAGEISHRWPHVLADVKALIFSVWTGPGFDEHRIERLSIADGKRDLLLRGADGVLASINGFLVHGGRNDGLLAVPWQTDGVRLQNVEPIVLPMEAKIDNEGAVAYGVSKTGTFAYLRGAADRRLARAVWVSRTGGVEPLEVPARDYVSAAISPDGTQAVLQVRGGTEELWVFDFGTKSFTPLPAAVGSSQGPIWSADGKSLIYRCTRVGFRNLCRRPADGTGAEERLTTAADVLETPTSISPDGQWIVFLRTGQIGGGGQDIWKLPIGGADRTPVAVLATSTVELNGQVSPDGLWMAYESFATGRLEVWAQPFSTAGPRRQISRDGGQMPRWSRDGRELFFVNGAGDAMMAVTVGAGSFSTPRRLFDGRYRLASNANTTYDVGRDGRFLFIQSVRPDPPATRIEIVLNGR